MKEAQEHIEVINHELRTPLTAIQGYIELAQFVLTQISVEAEDQPSYEQLANFLRNANEQAIFAIAMVDDLLALQRNFVVRLIRCDVGEIARATVEARQLLVPSRSILFQMPTAKAMAFADPIRVRQVITNYLNNALKYTPSGPITVVVETLEKTVRVTVRDEGPGISRQQLPHLWKKGYRAVTQSTNRGFAMGAFMRNPNQPLTGSAPLREGLGLGLFICKMLIERQRGRVGVESVPGRGTSFWFALPR